MSTRTNKLEWYTEKAEMRTGFGGPLIGVIDIERADVGGGVSFRIVPPMQSCPVYTAYLYYHGWDTGQCVVTSRNVENVKKRCQAIVNAIVRKAMTPC